MVDFNKLRGQNVGATKAPPRPPAGGYAGVITGHKLEDSRFSNKETGKPDGAVKLTIKPTEFIEGDLPDGVKLDGKTFTHETNIVDCNDNPLPGLYYTKKLAEGLGIKTEGRDIFEILPDMTGAQVLFELTERADKNDPEVKYNDVRRLRARV